MDKKTPRKITSPKYLSSSNSKRFIFTYQTKNLINGKTYVGVHTTNKLEDGYIGAGIKSESHARGILKNNSKSISFLARAVIKYGYKNFKREVLSFYDTVEEAFEDEAFMVTESYVNEQNNYNICIGGGAGANKKHLDKYPNIVRDFMDGMLVIDVCKKYDVCNAIVAEALKGQDKTKRNIETTFYNYNKDYIDIVRDMYERGESLEEIHRQLPIAHKRIKSIIKHYKIVKKNIKVIIIKDNETYHINYDDLHKFCKERSLFRQGAVQNLRKEISYYKGYRFYYEEEYNKGDVEVKECFKDRYKGLKFIDTEGNEIEVTTNLQDFANKRGLCTSGLRLLLSGKMRQHKGYTVPNSKYIKKERGKILPEDKVLEKYLETGSRRATARFFGVSPQLIGRTIQIKNGQEKKK